ncbi:lipopolysaccharide biosynthesis protein [uncultured Clostridium sp.]|uniref:lipopolysaccharide biosynthesis protein n=1 Tax=uncultured Clostridium sp. TaxID=59620 RepID=UPI0026DD5B52|nr:oligosaccharide flippase family protein [uncultured Clostridium sp.]
MSKSKELVKNTSIIFIGTFSTRLLSFLLLPLYTGFLTTNEYGVIDLFTTAVALISTLISFQISQGLFRYLVTNRDDEDKKKRIITSSFLFIVLISILYTIVFTFISPIIKIEYKIFLVSNVISNIIYEFLLQLSRGIGNNKDYSISGIVSAFTTIIFNIILIVFLKFGAMGMLLGTFIGSFSGVAFLYIKLKFSRYLSISSFDLDVLKVILKYSIPLVPNQLSWWIFESSDRIIVSFVLGLSFTGILSVSYKFSSAFIMLYNIFNLSWRESVILHIDDLDATDYFNKTCNTVLSLFSSISLGMIAFMPIVFKIMVNNNYYNAYNLIPITIVAAIFQIISGLLSAVYVAKNDSKSIAKSSIFSAIVNIIVHVSLIKFIGLYAAVVSTLVSYFALAIYRIYDVNKKYIKVKIKINNIIFFSISFLIVLICYYTKITKFELLAMTFSIIYFFTVNSKSFSFINKMIRKKISK